MIHNREEGQPLLDLDLKLRPFKSPGYPGNSSTVKDEVGLEITPTLSSTWRLASPRVIYECRIELFGLSIAPQLRDGFDHYRLKWMTRPLISYSPPLVREFYVSYCATVSLTMPKRAILRHVEHLQLKQTLMRRVMRLCDDNGVPEIPGADERVQVKIMAQKKMMKDPAGPVLHRRSLEHATVPYAQIEGPLVFEKPSDVQIKDVEVERGS
ncbi:hypothetical protein FXO38_24236 [Capsicum annuum]|nr:hypothetical protein FXO38_24236 [Capsicum annuum]